MAILHDFHMHSSFSSDSSATMESMIQSALDKKLAGICFTEHYDIDYPELSSKGTPLFVPDFDAYRANCLESAVKYQEKIHVSFGIELGLQPHLAEQYYKCIKTYPFDFIIGSIHNCNGKDPYHTDIFFKGLTEEEGYRKYFQFVLESLNAYDGFDSLGHLDYVIRYGPNKDKYYSYDKYKDVLDPILIKLISMGKALECNTGALSRGLQNTNPGSDVIKRYRELGGELVTIGSDAHKPESVSADFAFARSVLLESGFTHYVTFHQRIPQLHKL